MPLSTDEELELLQLEEEEYQDQLRKQQIQPPSFSIPFVSPEIGKALQGGSQGFVEAAPAMAAGAAQGATMGFSDELGAGVDVGADLLTGKSDMLSVPDKWRQYQKLREAANKKLAEESPLAYMGGEVAGGLATVPLMPSLGGAKLVGAAGKLSPAAARFLAGQAGGTAGKIAGKGVASAIEAAPVGALYGAWSSEADISRPAELAMDIVSGAGMASGAGLLLGAGAVGGKALIEGASDIPKKFDFTRKLGEAYEMGKEGVHFDTSAGKAKVAKLSQEIPSTITDEILAADKALGEAVGASLENSTKRINIDPEIKAASDDLFQIFADNPVLLQTVDPKSKALLMKLAPEARGDLTPVEARALKDTFYDLSDRLQGMSSDVANIARQKGLQLGKSLDVALKREIPEYAQAASKFAQFREMVPEVALQPGLPADKRTKMLGSLKHRETELYKGLKDVFGKARMPGAPTVEGSRAGLEEMIVNLKNIEASSPEAVKALGGTAEQVGGKWSKLADRMAVLRQAQGIEPHESLSRTMWGQIVGSGEGTGYNLAQKAGQIVTSKPAELTKKVFSYPFDKLQGVAQKLKTSNVKGAALYGEKLEQALANKNESAKNAVLFALMQDPDYREFLSENEENK